MVNSLSKRNLQIEGLRGIAILIIVAYHLIDRYQQIYLDSSIYWMDIWGTFGTTIFFIISGYFLAGSQINEMSLSKAAVFLVKKLARLWPCYAISISITYVVSNVWNLPGRTVSFKDYVLNLIMINRFLRIPYVDGAHWYVGVLLTITAMILMFSVFKIHEIWITYVVWLLVELLIDKLAPFADVYILGGPFVGIICTGIALKNVIRILGGLQDGNNIEKQLKWVSVILLAILCTYISRGWVCAVELCLIIVIFTLCALQKIPIINNRFCVFTGTISYPLYLIHQNIGFIIEMKLAELTESWNYIIGIGAIGGGFYNRYLFVLSCGKTCSK